MVQQSHERDEIRKQLQPFFEDLIETVIQARSSEEPRITELKIARAGDRLGAEAIGRWLLGYDLDASLIHVDGACHYRMSKPVEKTYHTQRGEVRLARHVYRPSGEHNGAIVCPLEARVGMVHGEWTPGCAEAMAYIAQELPERAASKVAQKLGAMAYSFNSFKRVARTLGARWEADRDQYEEATIQAFKIPDAAARLAVSIDRVSLLIDEEQKLNWRMAYCGTLTLYDGTGEPLKTLRYGRMPGEGAHILREQMKWDVAAICGRREDLKVVTLSDGAAELCNILDVDYPQAARYIDYYHVVEKLSAALTAFCNKRSTSKKAKELLAKWKTELLNTPNAIENIERTIKRWRAVNLEVGR